MFFRSATRYTICQLPFSSSPTHPPFHSLARNTRLNHPRTFSELSPYLNIRLPDLTTPPPEPGVHIPFTPDFWESSRAKAEAARALPEEPQVPKVIVVDSARADSISLPEREHITVEQHYYAEPSSVPPKVSNLRSVFLDVADDLMLPKDLSALNPNKVPVPLLDDLIDGTSTSMARSKFHPRTLDKDQVRGVWIILGLFAGSWLAGGLFKKDSTYTESE